MSKHLVNTTLLLVKDDIDHILAEQPDRIQKDFVERDLFTDLIAYVLSRVPNSYTVLEEGKTPAIKSHLLHESAERQLYREQMIRRGIYLVLEKSQHQNPSFYPLPKSKAKLSA